MSAASPVRVTAQRAHADGLPLNFRIGPSNITCWSDPANESSPTRSTYEGRRCVMPVAWTKTRARATSFYSALPDEEVRRVPARPRNARPRHPLGGRGL